MIDEISLASNWGPQAKCEKCKKMIKRFSVRGLSYGRYFGYLCSKCTKEELERAPHLIKELKEGYQKFTDMSEKERKAHLIKIRLLNKLS